MKTRSNYKQLFLGTAGTEAQRCPSGLSGSCERGHVRQGTEREGGNVDTRS